MVFPTGLVIYLIGLATFLIGKTIFPISLYIFPISLEIKLLFKSKIKRYGQFKTMFNVCD